MYDYWLIIWHIGQERVHSPMCFEVGVHPEAYCAEMTNPKGKDPQQFKPTGYEYHKLVIAE